MVAAYLHHQHCHCYNYHLMKNATTRPSSSSSLCRIPRFALIGLQCSNRVEVRTYADTTRVFQHLTKLSVFQRDFISRQRHAEVMIIWRVREIYLLTIIVLVTFYDNIVKWYSQVIYIPLICIVLELFVLLSRGATKSPICLLQFYLQNCYRKSD